MSRPVSIMIAVSLIITCSGCFWGFDRGGYDDRNREGYGEHDRGGHDDRDRGGHDGEDRHDDRGGNDDHR